jgi:hypothetical protein
MINVYKCDTCKRTIEKQQNIKGLDVVGGCTITHKCRGSLSLIESHRDFIRPRAPAHVQGLQDWTPRKMLFNFTKTIKSKEWIIKHDLNSNPNVVVYVTRPTLKDANHQIPMKPASIVTIDEDTIKVTFDNIESGTAQLISRQTSETTEIKKTVVQNTAALQLSSKGEVTFAIAASIGTFTHLSLNVAITTPQNVKLDVSYAVDNKPSTKSPWRDFTNVIINGKVYLIYSFDAIVPEMALGSVSPGSTIKFTSLGFKDGTSRALREKDALLLLSVAPFELVDKVYDRYVDMVQPSTIQSKIYYSENEFFAPSDLPKQTYPLIRSA